VWSSAPISRLTASKITKADSTNSKPVAISAVTLSTLP
jgi:hypothetical protein